MSSRPDGPADPARRDRRMTSRPVEGIEAVAVLPSLPIATAGGPAARAGRRLPARGLPSRVGSCWRTACAWSSSRRPAHGRRRDGAVRRRGDPPRGEAGPRGPDRPAAGGGDDLPRRRVRRAGHRGRGGLARGRRDGCLAPRPRRGPGPGARPAGRRGPPPDRSPTRRSPGCRAGWRPSCRATSTTRPSAPS